MAKQRRLKPVYVALSKNLANYPLARDPRVRARWRRSTKTGRWLCDLPGDKYKRIQFRLPEDTDNPRGPTGFDMDVLFVLLRAAKVKNTAKISFASQASILHELGLDGSYNRRRLRDALGLWQRLSIRYRRWYRAARWTEAAEAKHIRKVLPPPIRSIETDARRLRITVDEAWREIATHYYAQVALPLPTNAAAQNLVLYLLTPFKWRQFPKEEFAVRRKVRSLCRKIGLNHNRRGAVLRRAVSEAQAWFSLHGIELCDYGRMAEHPGYITLGFFEADKLKRAGAQFTPTLAELEEIRRRHPLK